MKLLYCSLCEDIISSFREKRKPRACSCGEYVIWWEDPDKEILRVHTHSEHREHASIIEILNWLVKSKTPPNIDRQKRMATSMYLEAIGGHYDSHSKFGYTGSMIVRLVPGESDDIDWARLIPGVGEGD